VGLIDLHGSRCRGCLSPALASSGISRIIHARITLIFLLLPDYWRDWLYPPDQLQPASQIAEQLRSTTPGDSLRLQVE
ncbi:hypothetical protein QQ73_16285, partial [Candidatus Endoriftia persephone str. Guaymas]|nr:hypothetical protein [Candidatus Endoriftia persephone str. Guaymas]